jgi:hypothetical protein
MVKVMLVLAAIKTVGSALAAAISWECYLAWLVLGLLAIAGLGRHLVRRIALRDSPPSNPVVHGADHRA